jgi:predicted kinase
MKKLLLLAGLPGVGKSTVSGILIEKLGAKSVDIDDFKKLVVDSRTVTREIDPPATRWLYYQHAIQHVLDLFEQGISIVIMDEVFHLNSLRMQLEEVCVERGVQVVWIEVCCSYETVAKRLESSGRPGHILSTEEALAMHLLFKEIFEPFSGANNHKVVDNEDWVDVRQILDAVLQAV